MKDGTVDSEARKKFFRSRRKRITGAFDLKKHTEMSNSICGVINQIVEFTKEAIELQNSAGSIHRVRNKHNNPAHWINIRDHAKRLFRTLSEQWSCTCPCQRPHRASLLVDPLSGCHIDSRFVFAFSFDDNSAKAAGAEPPPWNWRDVEIQSLEVPNAL